MLGFVHQIKAQTPLCLTVLSGQALQLRSGAPKAQGLTVEARTEKQFGGRDDV
jgi:hypothetical protein